MSHIARRDMLKMMATTAGGAAAAIPGLSATVPVLASAPPVSPNQPPFGPNPMTTPRVPLPTVPGATYTYLDGLSDFNFRFSSTTWSQSGTGGIFPQNTAIDLLWTSVKMPKGALIIEIILSVIVNDANPASFFFLRTAPSDGSQASFAHGLISTMSASRQNVSLPISPFIIDNSQFVYGIYYGFGTANSETTHAFYGARIGWMNNPGLTLFPNPRRIVDGFATPFSSGVTYGPFDATLESDGVTPTGIPPGANPTAAFCAVMSYSPGVLTLFPEGTPDTHIGNYSGTGNLGSGLNMTYMMVPLSAAAKFKIHS